MTESYRDAYVPISVPAPIAVGTGTTPVVGANPQRRILILVNDSDTKMYLYPGAGPAVLGRGIPLYPNGGSWEVEWEGAIQAIHGGTGTKNLCAVEL
jgi:hypothetical protein